ncbi:codeine O-demethylase-like [Rutidosis leptorrhynchoides]|uniref:codeine O-demethylase-like n=1 Tax=Rutidosis leptorrhynchoides TaxID=125765 RepID=UPI003A9951C7
MKNDLRIPEHNTCQEETHNTYSNPDNTFRADKTPVNQTKNKMMQVQEIAETCKHLPERYVRKQEEEYRHFNTTYDPNNPKIADIPIIDFSILTSSRIELDKLTSALSTWGCIQAVNHGIESSFLEKLRETGKLFFKLPADERNKCLREEHDIEGYGNDNVLSDHQTLDWNDRLHLSVLPLHRRKYQFWPQNPTHFREVLDEYCSKMELINEFFLKAMAKSLNLDENCFWDQYGKTGTMNARFNYYPACPWPEKVLGFKPHADSTAITVLLQDKEIEGLQILKDDQWFHVPIVNEALTINVGDQIQIMSNGIFKSPVHRVFVDSKRDRMTLAMICRPQTEKDIGPVEGLITDKTPRLYKNVTMTTDFFFKYYQHGMRAIDACKI